jgi:hypothetical protein
MQNIVLQNALTSNQVDELLNNSIVNTNRDSLSETQKVVKFSIPLTESLKIQLETIFSIHLSNVTTLPMRWIKGDTSKHIDHGESSFNNTHLIYLTDSIGSLFVDGQEYAINAGDAHIFSEGLEHYTINTGDNERLILGPMSESGFPVETPLVFFATLSDAQNNVDPIGSTGNYDTITINGISSWLIYDNTYYNTIVTGTLYPPYIQTKPYYSTNYHEGIYRLYPNNSVPISNICFLAKTPITTDQGVVVIEKIQPELHSIRNQRIVTITKTITNDKYLVCFEKNSIGHNIPCEKTIVSKNHLIFNKGKMIKAKDFIGKYDNIYKIKYNGEILYNVLLEKYDKMVVNNLICETLHPNNMISKLYTLLPKYTLEQQYEIIEEYNKEYTKITKYMSNLSKSVKNKK